jgi:hypothetical protein
MQPDASCAKGKPEQSTHAPSKSLIQLEGDPIAPITFYDTAGDKQTYDHSHSVSAAMANWDAVKPQDIQDKKDPDGKATEAK